MENIELQHHGTKGQKWGIRRFQNKDGSLTPEGKKRYGVVDSIKAYRTKKQKQKQLEKARLARTEKKNAAEQRAKDLAAGKIRIKDMTDDEIKARTARLQMEKTLRDLENEMGKATIIKGKRFVNKFSDSTIDKIAENVGADLIAQALKSVAADAINKKAFGGDQRVFDNNKKKG